MQKTINNITKQKYSLHMGTYVSQHTFTTMYLNQNKTTQSLCNMDWC